MTSSIVTPPTIQRITHAKDSICRHLKFKGFPVHEEMDAVMEHEKPYWDEYNEDDEKPKKKRTKKADTKKAGKPKKKKD